MKKEYIIGGLAIVGGLSLLAYLTSKPRRNSEGFFNARGQGLGNTDGLPNAFTRKPFRLKPDCVLYKRAYNMPDGSPIYKKFLAVNNNFVPLTTISYTEFKNAYYNLPKCM